MRIKILPFLLSIALASWTGAPSLSAKTIYQETFGNPTGTNQTFTKLNIGWKVITNQNFEDETGSKIAVSPADSAPADAQNIGTGVKSLSSAQGVAYLSGSTDQPVAALYMTTGFPIERPAGATITFHWYAGNNSEDVTQRLAVRIGSDWYVSDEAFTTLPVGSASQFHGEATEHRMVFSHKAQQWRDLAYVPGSALEVADTARSEDLPEGEINGFGVLIEAGSGTGRFDTFAIEQSGH